MDEKSQKNTKQILETGNSEFDQPDDISEDAKLADNLHKFGGLTRSHHVVGGHWRLKTLIVPFIFVGTSMYLDPVHEDVGISFLTVFNLLVVGNWMLCGTMRFTFQCLPSGRV